jgi:hypothetical protein
MVPDLMNRSTNSQIKMINDMVERAKVVGNLPQYIGTAEDYDARVETTDLKTKDLTAEEVKLLFNWDGITASTKVGFISGCVFSVNAKASESSTTNEVLSYDGEHGYNYGLRTLSIMSESVGNDLVCIHRENILSLWAKERSYALSAMGCGVEELFWEDLKKNVRMKVRRMKNKGEDFFQFQPGKSSVYSAVAR